MTSPTTTLPLRTGGAIPVLGLGTWRLRGDEAREVTARALEMGYRHVDTATIYGNEAEVGQALRECGLPRDQVFVTTKLPEDNAGRERATLEESLRLLGLDQVDLWLVHWPPGGEAAPQVWEQLLALRDEGLARAVGVSNYSTAQVDELVAATGEAPAVNQVRWSPWVWDAALVEHHRALGVVVEGYSPFRASQLDDPVLTEVAHAHGVTPAQVVLRWHVERDFVAIPKSASPERLAQNLDVFGFQLTDEERARIDALGG